MRMASERGSTILGNWFKPFKSPQMTFGSNTLIKSLMPYTRLSEYS